ncbi:MAG: hypothetical protein ACREFG_08795, partial [Chthoniobacterales bacterium]
MSAAKMNSNARPIEIASARLGTNHPAAALAGNGFTPSRGEPSRSGSEKTIKPNHQRPNVSAANCATVPIGRRKRLAMDPSQIAPSRP